MKVKKLKKKYGKSTQVELFPNGKKKKSIKTTVGAIGNEYNDRKIKEIRYVNYDDVSGIQVILKKKKKVVDNEIETVFNEVRETLRAVKKSPMDNYDEQAAKKKEEITEQRNQRDSSFRNRNHQGRRNDNHRNRVRDNQNNDRANRPEAPETKEKPTDYKSGKTSEDTDKKTQQLENQNTNDDQESLVEASEKMSDEYEEEN